MLKRILNIFKRDIKVNTREAMPFFLIAAPLLFAIGINLITPGINDTTVNIVMISGEDEAQAEYFDDFAHVELVDNTEAVKDRVNGRDSVVGIIKEGGEFIILAQGNEAQSVLDYTKMIKTFYESGVKLEDARSEIVDFGKTTPPLKKMMVNVLLLMNMMLVGMLISVNVVEEKMDNTVSAINVSPVSRSAFILGKGLTGMAVVLVMSIASLLITGFYGINLGQAALVIFASAILSLMVGIIQGINSNDVMEAAGSVKLMFLPITGSVIGYELVDPAWQGFFYWSPFYWAYRANDQILSKSGTWLQLLLYVAIILVICGIVYVLLAPRIRKGLEQ